MDGKDSSKNGGKDEPVLQAQKGISMKAIVLGVLAVAGVALLGSCGLSSVLGAYSEGITTSAVAFGVVAVAGAALLGRWGVSSVLGANSDSNAGKKKMKASGRGDQISKIKFEDDPKGYFRKLRGKE